MGCDIHCWAEIRNKETRRWELAPCHGPEERWGMAESDPHYLTDLDVGRDYDLFAILAGVRNRNDVTPIAEPRGLPADMDPRLAKMAEIYLEHTPSWLLVREVVDGHDWDRPVVHSGLVAMPAYERWVAETGSTTGGPLVERSPGEYCQGVGGQSVRIVDRADMDRMIAGRRALSRGGIGEVGQAGVDYYARVEWSERGAYSCAYFWRDVMPRLLAMGRPEDVRIVFWFDS